MKNNYTLFSVLLSALIVCIASNVGLSDEKVSTDVLASSVQEENSNLEKPAVAEEDVKLSDKQRLEIENSCWELAQAQFLLKNNFTASALNSAANNIDESGKDKFRSFKIPNPLSEDKDEQCAWNTFCAVNEPSVVSKYVLILKNQYWVKESLSLSDENQITQDTLKKAQEDLVEQSNLFGQYQKMLLQYSKLTHQIATIQTYLHAGQYELAEKNLVEFEKECVNFKKKIDDDQKGQTLFLTTEGYAQLEKIRKDSLKDNPEKGLKEMKTRYEAILKENKIDFDIVSDELKSEINSAFAIVYYQQGIRESNISFLENAIKKADMIKTAPQMRDYIQGLCYTAKVLLQSDDKESQESLQAAINKFKGLISSANADKNVAYLKQSESLLNYLQKPELFIAQAQEATMRGDMRFAVATLETGIRIYRSERNLYLNLLDAYRRSKTNTTILKEVFNRCDKVIATDDYDSLLTKSLFLSHLLDVCRTTELSNYESTVNEFNSKIVALKSSIKKQVATMTKRLQTSSISVEDEKNLQVQRASLAMAGIAMDYSISFTSDNSSPKSLEQLAYDSSIALLYSIPGKEFPENPFEKETGNTKAMSETKLTELRIQAHLAYSRSTLGSSTSSNKELKQLVNNVAALDGYIVVNNLEARLPYNNSVVSSPSKNLQQGDSLLMGLREYNANSISSIKKEIQSQSGKERDDMVLLLKSVYPLYLSYADGIDKTYLTPFIDNVSIVNGRTEAQSLAEEEFNRFLEFSNQSILDNVLTALQTLQLVREQKPKFAVALLFNKFQISANQNFSTDNFVFSLEDIRNCQSKIEKVVQEEEKALLLFSLAEALNSYNISFSINDVLPISRPELNKQITQLYERVKTISDIKSLKYINLMANRGYNRYVNDQMFVASIERYRSSANTNLDNVIKMTKEAILIHPTSINLWSIWVDAENLKLHRLDRTVPEFNAYIETLFKELDFLEKQNLDIKYGPEMLRGLACRALGQLETAVKHFDNAANASDALYQGKILAWSMGAVAEIDVNSHSAN